MEISLIKTFTFALPLTFIGTTIFAFGILIPLKISLSPFSSFKTSLILFFSFPSGTTYLKVFSSSLNELFSFDRHDYPQIICNFAMKRLI